MVSKVTVVVAAVAGSVLVSALVLNAGDQRQAIIARWAKRTTSTADRQAGQT